MLKPGKSQAYNQIWKSSFRLVWHAAITVKEMAILKDFPYKGGDIPCAGTERLHSILGNNDNGNDSKSHG